MRRQTASAVSQTSTGGTQAPGASAICASAASCRTVKSRPTRSVNRTRPLHISPTRNMPTTHGDQRPYGFNQTKGPCSLEKSVKGAKRTRKRESQDKPAVAIFECITDKHRGDGD